MGAGAVHSDSAGFYAGNGFHRFQNLPSGNPDVWKQSHSERTLEVDEKLNLVLFF